MKKIVVLLSVCLVVLVSCRQPMNTSSAGKETEAASKDENKNVVSNKEYVKKDLWALNMYGKQDSFTSEVSNTIFFTSLIKEKNMIPMFVIGKAIKQSGEISFIISAIINSNEYKSSASDKAIKIKLADNSIMEFDCIRKLQETSNGICQTMFASTITIKEINKLRKQNADTAVRINLDGGVLDFTLPPLFFEYLREI